MEDAALPEPGEPATVFEALIVPHRSLSPAGAVCLGCGLGGLGLLIGLRCWLLGAWPVIGFSVAEAGLIAWMLATSMRQARASELILLDEARLKVIRTKPNGARQERALSTAWLNVVLEERPGRTPRLVVGSRMGQEEIGDVLGEEEKRDLFGALRDAVLRVHSPRFDNPQLKD
jgi:uncharacterized membrane protein